MAIRRQVDRDLAGKGLSFRSVLPRRMQSSLQASEGTLQETRSAFLFAFSS